MRPRIRLTFLPVALTALAILVTAPAMAAPRPAMRTAAPTAPAPNGGPTGADEFRPTQVFGVQRAQTLMNGAALLDLGASGVDLGLGVTPDVQVDLRANLDLTGIGGSFSPGLGFGAGGKLRFVNERNLGVAGAVGLDVNKDSSASSLSTTLGIALPVSFWMGSQAGLHVMPGFAYGPTGAAGAYAGSFVTGLAFETEINPTWRFMASNVLSFGSATTDTYRAGFRIGLTPNTTLDVSLLNGSLTLGGSPWASGAANVTLFDLRAYFGGRQNDVRKAFAL
ncbi:MAG TPA: hypothetical protein V6D05_10625 [Stenomitos sp.]